jgi:hypothetical protein
VSDDRGTSEISPAASGPSRPILIISLQTDINNVSPIIYGFFLLR